MLLMPVVTYILNDINKSHKNVLLNNIKEELDFCEIKSSKSRAESCVNKLLKIMEKDKSKCFYSLKKYYNYEYNEFNYKWIKSSSCSNFDGTLKADIGDDSIVSIPSISTNCLAT